MKKTIRYAIRITLGLLGLVILCWLGLAAYILVKRPTLVQKARTELQRRVGPESSIGDIELNFFRHFPHFTLHVSKVALRDSLWHQHHHDLLTAEHAYISIDLFRSLFGGKVQVGKVYLEQGSAYLYTDSTGYSNTNVFRNRDSTRPRRDDGARPPDIALTDIRVVVDQQNKHKLYDLEVKQLDCAIEKDDRALHLGIRIDALVKNFMLNIEKGSFIKDKELSGVFKLTFNSGSKILQGEKIKLQIGGHPFLLSGRFFPDVHPDPFFINIETENIPFAMATSLLTPALQQKLDGYAIDRPVNVSALIDAGSAEDPNPLISVKVNVAGNSLNTPAGRFNNASFRGSFSNEYIHGQPRSDENSVMRFVAFSATTENIPVRSDTILITNLKRPILSCDLHSRFEFAKLAGLAGSKSLRFEKGTCTADIRYKGPLSENDSAAVSLSGKMEIDSGAISYLPYRFQLSDCNVRVRFDDQDVLIEKLEAKIGSTKILLHGEARNAVSLLDQVPNNVGINLSISSPSLALEDFSSVAGRPAEAETGKKEGKRLFGAPANRLDQLLSEGTIHLMLEAADLHYKKFTGAHARADLLFTGNEIRLQQMQLEQGSGSLRLSARLVRQKGMGGNPLNFQTHLEGVDLPKMFSEFNNFGQTALGDKNLKGRLTADIDMSGLMTDKGALTPGSLKGKVNFSIRGGQLLDFAPMEKIHEAVLKKRDLSEIRFGELQSELDLDSTAWFVHRMEIQSTALTMYVEGTYDMKAGPDMSLLVPLSNLKERNPDIPPANKGNDSKAGPSIRLRARTGEDGKLKVSWDPFKKALKAQRRNAKNNR